MTMPPKDLKGRGTPAIKHATNATKSSTRQQGKKKKVSLAKGVPVNNFPWPKEWKEEDLWVTQGRYDSRSIPPVDRFVQSACDFRAGWPPPAAKHLNNLWDQFRRFTGLLVDRSVCRKAEPDADARPIKRRRSDRGNVEVAFPDPRRNEEDAEEKISIFLSDPEKAIRIFLSSYMRKHGLMLNERNLIDVPRLISSFLKFVLHNHILLPASRYQPGMTLALQTVERAKKELPLTLKAGRAIPDAFNGACRELFGRHETFAFETATNAASGTTEEKRKASINVNQMDGNGWDNSWDNSWGDGESTGWNDAWATDPAPGAEGSKEDHPNQSLFALLGPSVFPMTHMTGIVESSTRRVTAVHFPPNYPNGTPLPASRKSPKKANGGGEWMPSPSGLEAELDARFAKVILEPWGRGEGDILQPEISSKSRGPAIYPNKPLDNVTMDGTGMDRKPHNPLTDNIILLVEPSLGEILALVPGLGLTAMWIEIMRQEGYEKESSEGGSAEHMVAWKFWYHEDVSGIFPSYYAPQGE